MKSVRGAIAMSVFLVGIFSALVVPVSQKPIKTVEKPIIISANNGKPYCSPTGEGVCNMSFWSLQSTIGITAYKAYVYNRYCDETGRNDNIGTGKFEVYSSFKYVVVGDNGDQSFCYANKCYGDKCIKYWADDKMDTIVKQCAFDCYQT